MKRREFIIKSTFAGLALTAATPLLDQRIAAAAPNINLPKRKGEGERWSPSLKDIPAAAKPAFWLAQDGKPKATIIIAANAIDTNQEAAELLQEYVRKISGATLPIADDSKAVEGAKVLIGRSKFVDQLKLNIPNGHTNAFAEEGYIIKQIGDQLVLAGNDNRPSPVYKGSLFAVIEILQRLGCRWYMPGEFGEVFSHSRDVSLPKRRHSGAR